MKIVLVDFSKDAKKILDYFPEGHAITTLTDGGLAYTVIGEIRPEMVFINYSEKPSHGRQTAAALRKRKSSSAIPIFFVDGNPDENTKVADLGICITSEEISNHL